MGDVSDPSTAAIPVKAPNNPLRPDRVSWRQRAWSAVRAETAPTWSLDLRSVQDSVGEQRSRAVIDLAMRIAESTLSTGASAADVTATVLRLTDAYGLRSVHVDVTFTSITVSHHRGADDPVTIMRTVRTRSADYDRLARLQAFVRDLEANPVDIVDARQRFDAIAGRPHPYRRSVVTLAAALLGASVCLLLDGSGVEILIATMNAVLIDRAQLWLSRRRLAAFFSQLVGGAITTAMAVLLITLGAAGAPGLAGLSASAIVAAGIVGLLAGLSVVGAAQDAIDGYYVTAGARTFEVIVLTLGIIVGVLIALGIAHRLGAPTRLAPYSDMARDTGTQILAAALIAAAFAVASYAGPLTVLVSVVTGCVGWIGYSVGITLGMGLAGSNGLAALVVGFISQWLASMFKVPSLALTTAGIVPLLPGGLVYRGLYQLTTATTLGSFSPAMITLGTAAAVGLALAAGVSLGTFLARPLRRDVVRSATRASRRALRRGAADGRE